MNEFGNYLYSLRKSKGMTQQELADLLGVTNKAVSKWETGEAFPETAQLVPLANIFGVTVDDLLRGRGSETHESPQAEREDIVQKFLPESWRKKFALLICIGVGLILAGVLIIILIGMISGNETGMNNELTIRLGACAMLAIIAAGVDFCIAAGILNDKAFLPIPDSNWRKNVNRFAAFIVCGFTAVMLGVICFVYFSMFEEKSLPFIIGMAGGFVFIFFGVSLFVYGGITWDGYSKKAFADFENKYVPPLSAQEKHNEKRKEKLAGTISSVIMLTATIIFLLLGFLGNLWHPGWVVFPVGGILCGIVSTILGKQ